MKKLPLILSLLWIPLGLHADLNTAQRLITEQRFEQALQSVETLLKTQPRDQQALFLKAVTLQHLGRTDDAIGVYQTLNREYPSLPEPYNNLAVLYARQGKQEKARDALLGAINTHSSYATAYENLGVIYAQMAVKAYNKALELDEKKKPAEATLTLIEKLDIQQAEVVTVASAPLADKPAVADAAPAIAQNNEVELIIDTIKGWSNAWSAQNSEAYLAYYAAGFNPANGHSRQRWERERRIRLRKPAFIRVSIQSPKVEMLSAHSARLTFKQDYQSNKFRDAVEKTLLLEKVDGSWQILKEFTSS